jgi:hypothetical protein
MLVQRFINRYSDYLDAVSRQADDRTRSFITDYDSYMRLRRFDLGALPMFDLLVPSSVEPAELDHPAIDQLELLAVDLIIFVNVGHSFHIPSPCWRLS